MIQSGWKPFLPRRSICERIHIDKVIACIPSMGVQNRHRKAAYYFQRIQNMENPVHSVRFLLQPESSSNCFGAGQAMPELERCLALIQPESSHEHRQSFFRKLRPPAAARLNSIRRVLAALPPTNHASRSIMLSEMPVLIPQCSSSLTAAAGCGLYRL